MICITEFAKVKIIIMIIILCKIFNKIVIIIIIDLKIIIKRYFFIYENYNNEISSNDYYSNIIIKINIVQQIKHF